MSLTPTQLSELQTIVETLRTEFASSDDDLWQAAIRIQKGGLGPVTGSGGQAAFDAAVADIVEEAEQISTVQGKQGGLGSSFTEATFNVVPIEGELPAGAVGDVIYLNVAPNTYLATSVIELTPAGPNSVVLSEIGTQVARTVSAANGGLEVNNLNTGVGFERVLTTSDAGGGGTPGGANTNVQYNNAGAFGGDSGFTYDGSGNVDMAGSQSRLTIDETDGGGDSRVQLTSTTTADGGGALLLDSTVGRLALQQTDFNGNLEDLWVNCQRNGAVQFYFNGVQQLATSATGITLPSTGGTSIYLAEKAAANADVAGQGQFWVRTDLGENSPMFTTETGVDYALNLGTLANPFPVFLVINADILVPDPPTTETPLATISFRDLDGSTPLGSMGYEGLDNSLSVFNFMRGGNTRLRCQNAAGLIRTPVDADPDGAVQITYPGFIPKKKVLGDLRRFETESTGIAVFGSADFDGNPTLGENQDAFIALRNNSGDLVGEFGFVGESQLFVYNDVYDGRLELYTTDSTGGSVAQLTLTPTGPSAGIEIFMHNGGRQYQFVDDPVKKGTVGRFNMTGSDGVTQGDNITIGFVDDILTPVDRAVIGFEGDDTFRIRSTVGAVRLNAEVAAASGSRNLLVGIPVNEGKVIFVGSVTVPSDERAHLGFDGSSLEFEVKNLTASSSVTIKATNSGLAEVTFLNANPNGDSLFRGQTGVRLQAVTGTLNFQVPGTLFTMNNAGILDLLGNGTQSGVLRITEGTSSFGDVAGLGQFWVRDDTPNVPMFTDDAGTDFVLNAGGVGVSGTPVNNQVAIWTDATTIEGDASLTFNGSSLAVSDATFFVEDTVGADSITISVTGGEAFLNATGGTTLLVLTGAPTHIADGHLFIAESASGNADVTGRGQLWVRTETFSNTLMFTNDNGNEFIVAGLAAQGDISTGSVVIAGTTFVAVANVGPRINTDYIVIASVEVTAPAADDMNIQFTIDTNARFYGTLTNTEDDVTAIIEGQLAEVVTNNVLVPTSGTATPGGTYCTIIGRLVMGATTGTMSLRCAKNADTGVDGAAIRAAIQLIPIDPQ